MIVVVVVVGVDIDVVTFAFAIKLLAMRYCVLVISNNSAIRELE